MVITWDGRSPPCALIDADADPAFDWLIFDYSGRGAQPYQEASGRTQFLSQATECKGQIFAAIAHHVSTLGDRPDYVGLIDDDVALTVSGINAMLATARSHALGSFSAALTQGSCYSHARFLQRPGSDVRIVPWVEVMMPFYRTDLLVDGAVFFEQSISSYGIDQFVMPLLHHVNGGDAAIIDSVLAEHRRPITSQNKRFSNGRTALEERRLLRAMAMHWVLRRRPQWRRKLWYYRTFAPVDGPAEFWPTWLAWPINALRK